MEQFSSDLQELNTKRGFIGDELAAELSSRFGAAEHAVSSGDGDELAALGVQTAGNAGVIALLPLDSSPATRHSLEQALRGIVSTGQGLIVVDMDIASPHSALLDYADGEGASDHILYGVSPSRLLVSSSTFDSIQVMPAGTFTPRAAEIYASSGWSELIDSLAAESGGTVVLLAPPVDKFPALAVLARAEKALFFADKLSSEAQQELPGKLATLTAGLGGSTELRFVWIDSEQPESDEDEAEPAELSEDARPEENLDERAADEIETKLPEVEQPV